MTKSRSSQETSVPLYLLPRAIAYQINRMGDRVYRISVKRTHWHHYNISVRVRALPRELVPVRNKTVIIPALCTTRNDTGHNPPGAGCEA